MKKIKLHKILAAFFSFCAFRGLAYSTHVSLWFGIFSLILIAETWYALYYKANEVECINLREQKKANITKRLLAVLLDYLFINIAFFCISICIGQIPGQDYRQITESIAITFVEHPSIIIIYFLYFGLFEMSKLQATPAKLLLKLKVQNDNGERISASQSFYRQLGKANEVSACYFYLLINLFSANKRTDGKMFHDLIGNSIVVENK